MRQNRLLTLWAALLALVIAAARTAPAEPADDMWMSEDVVGYDLADHAPPAPPAAVRDAVTTGTLECHRFGDAVRSMAMPHRFRGNVFTVDKVEYLSEIRMELEHTGLTDLHFIVMEAGALDGHFSLVHQERVGTNMQGRGWYASGPVNVALLPGRYYAIGAGWGAEPVRYFFMETGAAPQAWPLGTVERGISGGPGAPLRQPTRLVLSTSLYVMQLCFGRTPCDSLDITIDLPADDSFVSTGTTEVSGTVHYDPFALSNGLDFVFVLDTSGSLTSSDPQNFRSTGAANLVELLPPDADVRIGVASFGGRGYLRLGLTEDRNSVVTTLMRLERSGATAMGEGLQAGLDELLANGRPDTQKFIILFSDGMHNTGTSPLPVASQAARAGIPVHTLYLGSDSGGVALMRDIAAMTGGVARAVLNPNELPDLFQSVLPYAKIDRIEIRSSVAQELPITIPAEDITGSTWSIDLVPVRSAPGLTTTLTATVYTTNHPPCAASDSVLVRGGTAP